ncbi:MAG: FecR domain-containing protein [Odoribacter sp.]
MEDFLPSIFDSNKGTFFMDTEEMMQHILLLLKGKATENEERLVREWFDESEEHRKRYKEICETYYKLQFGAQWKEIDLQRAIEKCTTQIGKKRPLNRRIYRLSTVAALLLLCIGIMILMRRPENNVIKVAVCEDVRFGEKKAMLTLADGKQINLTEGKEVNVDFGFAQAMEDSTGGLVYRFKDTLGSCNEYHTLTVPRAGEYVMVLSDGSRVWLNSETEMKYPVVFSKDRREVFVTGEAFFEVVKDSTRPFIVCTAKTRTTVLGTSFNVMSYQDEQQTEITLVQGAVSVDAGKDNCRILPGQQVLVNNRSLKMDRREVNASFYTSWKDGLFDFDNMPLSELVAKLERWYDVDFFFMSRDAAERRFTGAIKRNNTLQFMLDFIQKTSGVHCVIKGKTVTVCDN